MPALRAWIRTQPCLVREHATNPTPCWQKVQACHMPRTKSHGDPRNLVPACGIVGIGGHQHEQHTLGVQSFAAKYGLDLQELADWYWNRYQNSELGNG